MAKLTFIERYRTDTRFKERADGLLMESIFAMAGIDAQNLCRLWETGDRILKLEDVATRLVQVDDAEKSKPKATTRRSTKKADATTGDDG